MALRYLYVDMNSYFASVEQQLRPELRGRPIAVAAVDVDTTSCIAASVEAKRLGIRTGTSVAQARQHGVTIVRARPAEYVRVHHAMLRAVETCLPIHTVHSIDELSCRLSPREVEPPAAVALARRVKSAICEQVGASLTCSIGLAPNRILAKVAADMQKPDGLVYFRQEDLPEALFPLGLADLPGVGPQMLARLNGHGIATLEQLCRLTPLQMRRIWDSVAGERWWHWLRGHDLPERPTERGSIGHSHVLAPPQRTEPGAWAVLVRLLHKAAARLRSQDLWAGRLELSVALGFREPAWTATTALGLCQDTLSMIQALEHLWRRRPYGCRPIKVGVRLTDLTAERFATRPLFEGQQRRVTLSRTMDQINRRFGQDAIYFAGMHGAKGSARTLIAFNHIPELAPDGSVR